MRQRQGEAQAFSEKGLASLSHPFPLPLRGRYLLHLTCCRRQPGTPPLFSRALAVRIQNGRKHCPGLVQGAGAWSSRLRTEHAESPESIPHSSTLRLLTTAPPAPFLSSPPLTETEVSRCWMPLNLATLGSIFLALSASFLCNSPRSCLSNYTLAQLLAWPPLWQGLMLLQLLLAFAFWC